MAQTRAERYQQQVALIVEAERYWGPIHKAQDDHIKFLIDGEHYDDGPSSSGSDGIEKDRRAARWVGQEAFDVWRHEFGAVRSQRSQCYAKPLDEGGNEDLGEIAVAVVNSHLEDPMVMWEDTVDDVVGSASACGVGWARVADFDSDDGPFGVVFDESGDPRQFMWDPRAKSIHERRCRWVIIRCRDTVRAALTKKGWKASVVKKLRADNGFTSKFARQIETADKWMRSGPVANQGINSDEVHLDDEFTYYQIWERLPGTRMKPVSYREFDPGERHLQCPDCHWRSGTQDELATDMEDDALQLPETAVGPCPQCGSTSGLKRQDAEVMERSVKGYPRFNVTVVCPYSGPKECIFDDEPEIAYRSYPFMHLTRFRHPTRPVGPSLASLNGWNQVCVDLIMTLAVERLMDSAPIWSVPDDGVTDIFGQSFEFTDENGRVLKREPQIGAGQIELLEGTGIPSTWPAVYANAMNALTSRTGITDFGLGESQSRDIPAGSVMQQIQQQEIPLGHYMKRIAREIARAYGLIFDALRETDSPEKLNRLRQADGSYYMTAYPLMDLPNFDFYLDTDDEPTALDDKKIKGTEMLLSTIETRPWALELVADLHHIPQSQVRKVRRLLAAQPPANAADPAAAGVAPDGAQGNPGAQAAPEAAGQPAPQDMVAQLIASLGGGGMQPNQ